MSSTLTIKHENRTLVIPIVYSTEGTDRFMPCVTEILEALSALAVLDHRRSLGEVSKRLGGVDIDFEYQDANGRLGRAWAQAERFLR